MKIRNLRCCKLLKTSINKRKLEVAMLDSIEKLEFIWFFFCMYLFVAVIRATIADFTFDGGCKRVLKFIYIIN